MAVYIPFGYFTMVGTPHAIEQCKKRANLSLVEFLDNGGLNVPELFDKLKNDECFAVPVSKLLVYFKRKYNSQRRRWELECISVTPSEHVHTRERKFALTVEKKATQSTFPDWFADDSEEE